LVEQGIGADRLVARPHEFEDAAPQRREAQLLLGTQLFRRGEGVLDAVTVVVVVMRGLRRVLHRESRFAKRLQAQYRRPSAARPSMPIPSRTYAPGEIDAFLAAVQFNSQGLVAAIAQQHDTGEVLMMAWMDRDAVMETMRTGRACYWSR